MDIIKEFGDNPVKTICATLTIISLLVGFFIWLVNKAKKYYLKHKTVEVTQDKNDKKTANGAGKKTLVSYIQALSSLSKVSSNKSWSDFQLWFTLNFTNDIKCDIKRLTKTEPTIEDEKDIFKWFPVKFNIIHLSSNTLLETSVLYDNVELSNEAIDLWSKSNNDCDKITFKSSEKIYSKKDLINLIVERYNQLPLDNPFPL